MQTQFLEMTKTIVLGFIVSIISFLTVSAGDFAFNPNLVYSRAGDIEISNTQTSQAFYDELKDSPRYYFLNSSQDFDLYLKILVPEIENSKGKYSANVFSVNDDGTTKQLAVLDGLNSSWIEYYESLGREYYLEGPKSNLQLPAGKYKVEVFGVGQDLQQSNLGKYVLVVGKDKFYDFNSIISLYVKIPTLKLNFFKTPVWQFLLSPLGILAIGCIGLIFILLAIFYFFIGVIKQKIKESNARTILLTSGGMTMKEEISKLLQKPAYDITVAYIVTAAKTGENIEYLKNNYDAMREMGFNVLEIDIEGKTENQVRELLELRDIVFVEDGNAFLLMKSLYGCNFAKIMKKLLKQGKVYLGCGAGSVVAGKTLKSASLIGQENIVNLRGNSGLGLVNFDVFVHYKPEMEGELKKKIRFKFQRRKISFLTDEQAMLVQGNTKLLIGEGNKIDF